VLLYADISAAAGSAIRKMNAWGADNFAVYDLVILRVNVC
jgi:hypothetical protein